MTTAPTVSRPSMKGYGLPEDGAPGPLKWEDVEVKLAASRNYWICTTRPDGRPHAMPVWGVWHAGALYFSTGEETQKARNLAHQPAVVVHLESGDDCVILEGDAVRPPNLPMDALNAAYQAKYTMKMTDAGENASIFEVRPQRAFAWLESDFVNTATRWRW